MIASAIRRVVDASLKRRMVFHGMCSCLCLALALAVGVEQPIHAAPSSVTNLNDSGAGSLRQAIADASPGDTITVAVAGTITLTSGELVVEKDLTISGPGAARLSINGNRATPGQASRVLRNTAHLTIADLTISEGTTAGVASGGGILNASTGVLTITRSVFSSNFGYQGGAIYNSAGGRLRVNDSTFVANFSTAQADSNGGAIYNAAPGGVVMISGSTFNGNIVHDHGSALYNEASATVVNSTIAYNQAGTAAVSSNGDLLLNNVTIIGNDGRKEANGLRVAANSTTVVQNSIIAANTTSGNRALADCSGSISSGGHNLIGYADGCAWIIGTGDQLGTANQVINPNLGPLQDNGGPTLTALPNAGSPAIDAGSPAAPGSGGSSCAATDQRGVARPTIGASSATCDMGATELGVASLVASNDGPTPLGQTTKLTASGVGLGFSYHWDFGDGTSADGNPVTHIYSTTGSFLSRVTATSGPISRTATTLVNVTAPATTPSPTPVVTPVLTQLDPAVVPVNSPDFTLVVSGTNFVAGALIYVGGSPRATILLPSGQLSATVLASDIAAIGTGTIAITVVNPTPGGRSNALLLAVRGEVPAPGGQRRVLLPFVLN